MASKTLYIIAGSSGLIGSHVCMELEHLNKKFVGLDVKDDKFSYKVDLQNQKELIEIINNNLDDSINNISFIFSAGKNGSVEYGGLDVYGSFNEEDLNDYLFQNTILPYSCSISLINFVKEKKLNLKILILCSHYSFVAGTDSLYSVNNEGMKQIKPHGYIISKHAAVGVVKSLASTYGSDQVLINGFAPGGVFNNQDDEFVKQFKDYSPLGSLAHPKEISKWIVSIANPRLTYANGSIFNVDGGVLSR